MTPPERVEAVLNLEIPDRVPIGDGFFQHWSFIHHYYPTMQRGKWTLEEICIGVGNQYLISYKPSPAIFAEDKWNPQKARLSLVEALEKTIGCNVEVILQDISTLRYQPQRLWE